MTPRWPHVSAATVERLDSVESHARGRRIVVLLVRCFVVRCPRHGVRREERRFTYKSGSRLWPRHDNVEEQATERYADRERVRQLGSPPSGSKFGVATCCEGCAPGPPATWAPCTGSAAPRLSTVEQ